jgi:nucleoredoxin
MNRSLHRLLLIALLSSSFTFAAESWTNLDGQKMEAEFIARKGDYVSFKKNDGSRYLYPYEKLTSADKARVDALASGLPAPQPETDAAKPAPAAEEPAPAAESQFARQLAGKLVAIRGKSLSPVSAARLSGTKFYAIYYSAHWCPPCRAFTPELVDAYKKIKARRPEFELIFVSSDKNEDAMKDYMLEAGMPWPALRYADARSGRFLPRPGHERGIPNLVFVDANGKDIATTFTADGDYQGPGKVLRDINRHFKL